MTGPNGSRKAGTFSMSFFSQPNNCQCSRNVLEETKDIRTVPTNCSNDPLSRKAMVSKPEK